MLVLVSVLRGTETLVDGETEGTAVGLLENGFAGGLTDSVAVLLLPFVFVGAALEAGMVVVLRAGAVEVAGREGVRELGAGAGPVPLLLLPSSFLTLAPLPIPLPRPFPFENGEPDV